MQRDAGQTRAEVVQPQRPVVCGAHQLAPDRAPVVPYDRAATDDGHTQGNGGSEGEIHGRGTVQYTCAPDLCYGRGVGSRPRTPTLAAGLLAVLPVLLHSGCGAAAGPAMDDLDGDRPNASPDCGDVQDWDGPWVELERALRARLDTHRERGARCGDNVVPPSEPLAPHPALACAARRHARDMAVRDFFGAQNPDGDRAEDRVVQAGYPPDRGVWEALAGGASEPALVVDLWLENPTHCSKLMDPDAVDVGVGHFEGAGERGRYWVTIVGGPPQTSSP